MPVICREDKRQLTALVAGELDHHEARNVMEEQPGPSPLLKGRLNGYYIE